jgi:hypothetical protein
MMGSFIILPLCKFAKLTVNTVVSEKRLSMVHSDNKLPFEDMLKKSSEYFESANNTLVAYKGAMLFMSMESAEEKAKFLEEKALSDRKLLEEKALALEEKALALEEKANSQIKLLEFKLLSAKQAVTSRGILEHFLKGSQLELGLKGNFNAASVCEALKKPQKVIVLYALLLIGFDNIPTLHLCRKLEG